jgi:prepilin-type N-terminal cleavage/methylation domain-containing protein
LWLGTGTKSFWLNNNLRAVTAYAILEAMRKGFNTQGFTIIEVMIVLAVTAFLIAAALIYVSGQQQKAQFTQSIHDAQSKVDDIINKVGSGYYATTGNFNCTTGGGVLNINPGTNTRGTNTGCIFIGRAIQFGIDDAGSPPNRPKGTGFNVYNLVGLQYLSGNILIQDLPSGKPDLAVETTEKDSTIYGLRVTGMNYTIGGVPHNTAMTAFITDFGTAPSGIPAPSARTVSLYAVKGPGLTVNNTQDDGVHNVDKPAKIVPADSVSICLTDGGNLQGKITIGSKGRQLTTTLAILPSGAACP